MASLHRDVGVRVRRGALIGFAAFSTVACGGAARASLPEDLDGFLDSVAVATGVPGYTFAAFDDRGILHHHLAGLKSAGTDEPVDAETVFEAASISKSIFAYIVLSLVESGGLDLDRPLGNTAPVVRELGYDPRSAELTPRVLLTHQGGLPNWRTRLHFGATTYEELFAPTDTLRFLRDPGTGYRYSGEGYVLLQRVVEETTGRGLNELAQEIMFAPLGMNRSSFLFDDRMQADHAKGHNRDGDPDKWLIGVPLASSTLHTTATDLAAFGVHLAEGLRDGAFYRVMAEPAVTVAAGGGWETRWGIGLGIVSKADSTYVYHGGNNVIFIADFIYGIEENLGYALLTNSANGQAMVQAVEHHVYGREIPGR